MSATLLRVGTSGDYPPFSWWPEDALEPEGFSIDVARALAAQEGLALEWVRFRWPDLVSDLSEQRFDVALSGVTIRPERSAVGLSSIPLTVSGAVVLVPRGGRLDGIDGVDGLRGRPGLSLAVNAGGHLERVARTRFPNARIEAVGSNAGVLDRLGEGAVDGVVTDSVEARLWQARWSSIGDEAQKPALRRLGPFTGDRKAALWHPERLAWAQRLDVWLLEAEASGRLAALRRRHGLALERTALPEPALLARIEERLSLMPAVARAKRILGSHVEDRTREALVLAAARQSVARAAARAARPAPDDRAVDELFAAQMEAARWIQQRALEQPATAADPSGSVEQARSELESQLRPALLRIGDRLADLLVAWLAQPGLPESGLPESGAVERALRRHALPARILDRIEAALRALRAAEAADASTPPPPAAAPGIAPSA